MKKIIVLLTVLLCLLAMAGCGGKQSSLIMGDVTGKTETITTPYADLRVSKTFYENTETNVVSENPYALAFAAKDGTKLFTVYVDQKADFLMGTLQTDTKSCVLYAKMEQLDSSKANYDQNCLFQEEINTIIENLEADYTFVRHQAVEGGISPDSDVATFEIKTSLVTLKYPARWKDKVKTEVKDDMVKFYDGETPLFDLVFKKSSGYLLGTYDKTPIYVVYYEAKTDDQTAMTEDVNVILQNLMKDDKFKVHINN